MASTDLKRVLDLGCGVYKVNKQWINSQLKEKYEYKIIGVGLSSNIDLDAIG
jgi:hypothetical protein